MTAENVAERYRISREDQDELAFTSQMRTKKALEQGRFKDEIVPVVIPGRKENQTPLWIRTNILVRRQPLRNSQIPSAFKESGTVTAGNSSASTTAQAPYWSCQELADRLG